MIIRGGSSGRENKKEKDYITRKCKGKVLQIRIKNSLIFLKNAVCFNVRTLMYLSSIQSSQFIVFYFLT